MEGEGSCDAYPLTHFRIEGARLESVFNGDSTCNMSSTLSMDSILPDDILERILSFLPVASVFRASAVCKRWHQITKSRSFLRAVKTPQKPWYFMFTCSDSAEGHAYDPILRKWYKLEVPCVENSNWFLSSSCGLVCAMDSDSRSRVFVCNPITREWKRLSGPPSMQDPDYGALAISTDRESHNYTVVLTKSRQVPDDYVQWQLTIHIYESVNESWVTTVDEVLTGWRGGDDSVICNGFLYCLLHSTGIVGNARDSRHGLIVYDLTMRLSHTFAMRTLIPAPCPLTCGRLMNLRNKVVMVGGIAKYDRPDIIKGIGIWELDRRDWREIARVPHRFFQGFGELDDVFASSGSDDLIYIQGYGSTNLLLFDMIHKQWRWSMRCPVSKRFPLQLFSGFCFEPRL